MPFYNKCWYLDLLVAALHRALALIEIDSVAVAVSKDLDLNMARIVDVLLDNETVVVECACRLWKK